MMENSPLHNVYYTPWAQPCTALSRSWPNNAPVSGVNPTQQWAVLGWDQTCHWDLPGQAQSGEDPPERRTGRNRGLAMGTAAWHTVIPKNTQSPPPPPKTPVACLIRSWRTERQGPAWSWSAQGEGGMGTGQRRTQSPNGPRHCHTTAERPQGPATPEGSNRTQSAPRRPPRALPVRSQTQLRRGGYQPTWHLKMGLWLDSTLPSTAIVEIG